MNKTGPTRPKAWAVDQKIRVPPFLFYGPVCSAIYKGRPAAEAQLTRTLSNPCSAPPPAAANLQLRLQPILFPLPSDSHT